MCRVYIYDDIEHFSDTDLAKAFCKVSDSRREKALEYLYATDRKQSVIAELLLRYALRDAYSVNSLPEMNYGIHNKPILKGENMPCFNLSHCSMAVACVVGDEAVGIDVEPHSSYCEDVAREVFNNEELTAVIGSPKAFAELWTKKESYLKYTGEGLTDSLKTLMSAAANAQFRTFHSERGYACTVCSRSLPQYQRTFVDKNTLLYGR